MYINGLPPNFKAEQLYALTSQFGTVLSCRTFTRQSADHPSYVFSAHFASRLTFLCLVAMVLFCKWGVFVSADITIWPG